MTCESSSGGKRNKPAPLPPAERMSARAAVETDARSSAYIFYTHTHFQVQGLEKGVSENEAPGPIGAYTTTHNDTITLMPNLIHRISFTKSHSQN